MSRVVVIGASGHVGTYLVPRLVEAGHEVIAVSRGQREPYRDHSAWRSVRRVTLDRVVEEQKGSFGAAIRSLEAEIVIDMICFTPASARHLVDALRGEVQHFLHTGTIWVHGTSAIVPTTEEQPRHPYGEYGTNKAAIETYLLEEARRNGFPATLIHPGHISGPGWAPVGPAGHLDPVAFSTLAQGGELLLPNFGMETVHHVHADDVARIFMCAIRARNMAFGEAFHVVSPAALTLKGYAEAMASWFGVPARLAFLPWQEWKARHNEQQARQCWEHISRSPNCSIAKAGRLLGFAPRYSSLEAVQEAVTWLLEHGVVVRRSD